MMKSIVLVHPVWIYIRERALSTLKIFDMCVQCEGDDAFDAFNVLDSRHGAQNITSRDVIPGRKYAQSLQNGILRWCSCLELPQKFQIVNYAQAAAYVEHLQKKNRCYYRFSATVCCFCAIIGTNKTAYSHDVREMQTLISNLPPTFAHPAYFIYISKSLRQLFNQIGEFYEKNKHCFAVLNEICYIKYKILHLFAVVILTKSEENSRCEQYEKRMTKPLESSSSRK